MKKVIEWSGVEVGTDHVYTVVVDHISSLQKRTNRTGTGYFYTISGGERMQGCPGGYLRESNLAQTLPAHTPAGAR